MLLKNPNKRIKPVMGKIMKAVSDLPHLARKSITFDRGTEFVSSPHLQAEIGTQAWFCDRFNTTPRNCLGWETPAEVFLEKMMEEMGRPPYPNINRIRGSGIAHSHRWPGRRTSHSGARPALMSFPRKTPRDIGTIRLRLDSWSVDASTFGIHDQALPFEPYT